MKLGVYLRKILTDIALGKRKPETDYQRITRKGEMLSCPLLPTATLACMKSEASCGYVYYPLARVDISVCESCPKTDKKGNECDSWHWYQVELRGEAYDKEKKAALEKRAWKKPHR